MAKYDSFVGKADAFSFDNKIRQEKARTPKKVYSLFIQNEFEAKLIEFGNSRLKPGVIFRKKKAPENEDPQYHAAITVKA